MTYNGLPWLGQMEKKYWNLDYSDRQKWPPNSLKLNTNNQIIYHISLTDPRYAFDCVCYNKNFRIAKHHTQDRLCSNSRKTRKCFGKIIIVMMKIHFEMKNIRR